MFSDVWNSFARTIRDAFGYFLRPTIFIEERNLLQNLPGFLVLVLATFVLALLAVLPISLWPSDGADALENVISELDLPLWQMLLLGSVFAPLVEETSFRAPLRPTPLMLALAASLWAMMLTSLLFTGVFAASLPWNEMISLILILFVTAGTGVAVFVGLRQATILRQIQSFYARRFALVFWISVAAFGLVHLTNYIGFSWAVHAPVALLLVLPQIVAGIMLGYARMRYGLIAAILAHGLYNAILISIAF